MNNARFVCNFKGINAQELEKQVLDICKEFFQNKQFHQKINSRIRQQLKQHQQLESQNNITQAQLIDKLAQGLIDAEAFKKQSQSITQNRKPLRSISEDQLQVSLQNVFQKSFTLNMLYPYIDEIHITKNKKLVGIYFKNEPLNIVKQQMQSSIV